MGLCGTGCSSITLRKNFSSTCKGSELELISMGKPPWCYRAGLLCGTRDGLVLLPCLSHGEMSAWQVKHALFWGAMLGLNSQGGNLVMPKINGSISKLAGPACPCGAFCCISHWPGAPCHLPALPSKMGFCSHLLFTSHLPKVSPRPGWKAWGRESTCCISHLLEQGCSCLGKEIVI